MHDSTQALRGKKLLLVGFTLFSMFFGAGNLIFPPFLGAQAGTALWLAFVGFAVSAIGLPIAGVAAVARAGGLPALAGRVHPRFAQVFAVLVYLSIGPCLAIPRTASTSFEMLTPLVGRSTPGQFLYSLVFFAAAYFVALKPEKLTQRLGRILCPALLVLIVVLFAGCILRPAAPGYGTDVYKRQVLRYLLKKNGLDPDKDVKIEYYSEASEVTAQMAAARKDAIAVLPQPYVTAAQMKDSGLRVVLDLTREWNRVCDTQLITGVTVVLSLIHIWTAR